MLAGELAAQEQGPRTAGHGGTGQGPGQAQSCQRPSPSKTQQQADGRRTNPVNTRLSVFAEISKNNLKRIL